VLQHGSRVRWAVNRRAIFLGVERQAQSQFYGSLDPGGVLLPDAGDIGNLVRRSSAKIGQSAIEVRYQGVSGFDGLWTAENGSQQLNDCAGIGAGADPFDRTLPQGEQFMLGGVFRVAGLIRQ
jgi:hypothetical protein